MFKLLLVLISFNSFAEYKYAPRQKPVKVDKSLTCIGIKWKNQKRFASSSQCKTLANKTAKFFEKNSRGLVKFSTKAGTVKVPYNIAAKNLNKAENMARAKYKSDLYMIVSSMAKRKYSNAGGNTAHLKGTLIRTGQHEVGHLLGFGHAGAYVKGKLDPYKDGLSVMGRFPSPFLTAPQYYDHGWYQEQEVALYEKGKVYELERSVALKSFGLKAVMIPVKYLLGGGNGKRDAFVSFPQGCKNGCAVLHLRSGGGSQRIKIFAGDYEDKRFTGLKIKILEKSSTKVKLSMEAPNV